MASQELFQRRRDSIRKENLSSKQIKSWIQSSDTEITFFELTIQVHKREGEENVEENGEPQKTSSSNPVPVAL